MASDETIRVSTSAEPHAQASVETAAQDIFRTTMSPYCPGLLLSDCPSGKATELKDTIRSELSAGKDSDQIRAELVVKYNAQLDARPPTSGFGALMWVVPVLLLAIGGVIAVRFIRSQIAR